MQLHFPWHCILWLNYIYLHSLLAVYCLFIVGTGIFLLFASPCHSQTREGTNDFPRTEIHASPRGETKSDREQQTNGRNRIVFPCGSCGGSRRIVCFPDGLRENRSEGIRTSSSNVLPCIHHRRWRGEIRLRQCGQRNDRERRSSNGNPPKKLAAFLLPSFFPPRSQKFPIANWKCQMNLQVESTVISLRLDIYYY